MAVTRRNLTTYRGDTFAFEVTVTNAGNPINVTGYDFRMTAKYAVSDPDSNAVFSITSPGNILLTNPSVGLVTVVVPSTATSSLKTGQTYRLQYDIQMYDNPGVVYTVASGILHILPDCSINV